MYLRRRAIISKYSVQCGVGQPEHAADLRDGDGDQRAARHPSLPLLQPRGQLQPPRRLRPARQDSAEVRFAATLKYFSKLTIDFLFCFILHSQTTV